MENANLKKEAAKVTAEIIEKACLKEGQVLVVGCSTSEIIGDKIGSNSSPEAAKEVFAGIYETAKANGIFVAVQCCEHLNRAIITEKAAVKGEDIVNVIPQPKAGGSLATAAYATFQEPVAVEEIAAEAGIDIGFTLIGMHIKKVAVPVRLENDKIGKAKVIAARSRPKFIGGCRAVYDENLL